MIPVGAVPCWAAAGHEPTLIPGAPDARWLGEALARRGVALRDAEGPTCPIGWIGAPRGGLGPARVRSWRAELARGGRWLLVAPDVGDAAWLAPGFERVDGPALGLRARARWEPPGRGGTGRLWPDGRGWFRFGRSFDVLAVEPADGAMARAPRLAAVRLAIGRGELTVVADRGALSDPALSAPASRAVASRLLEGWLPAPEALIEGAAALVADPDLVAALAEPPIADLLVALEGAGIGPALDVDPDRLPALRALGERGLAGLVGDRVRLTARGRAERERVSAIIGIRAALRRADLRA